MNRDIKITLKTIGWIGWTVLAIGTIVIPMFVATLSRDSDDYPLGRKLFLNAFFHGSDTSYDVDLAPSLFSQENPIEHIVPLSYAEAYDSVSGKRRESVSQVVRYPGHLAVTTRNLLSGERRYYIVDKSYDPETTNHYQIKYNYLFATADSASFIRKCKELNLPRHSSR